MDPRSALILTEDPHRRVSGDFVITNLCFYRRVEEGRVYNGPGISAEFPSETDIRRLRLVSLPEGEVRRGR